MSVDRISDDPVPRHPSLVEFSLSVVPPPSVDEIMDADEILVLTAESEDLDKLDWPDERIDGARRLTERYAERLADLGLEMDVFQAVGFDVGELNDVTAEEGASVSPEVEQEVQDPEKDTKKLVKITNDLFGNALSKLDVVRLGRMSDQQALYLGNRIRQLMSESFGETHADLHGGRLQLLLLGRTPLEVKIQNNITWLLMRHMTTNVLPVYFGSEKKAIQKAFNDTHNTTDPAILSEIESAMMIEIPENVQAQNPQSLTLKPRRVPRVKSPVSPLDGITPLRPLSLTSLQEAIDNGSDWEAGAACGFYDPDIFVDGRRQATQVAKAICKLCIVRDDCLEDALTHGTVGVRAGRTQAELRAEKLRRG